MNKISFSLHEAKAICEDLQCLIGHSLEPALVSKNAIKYVVPAPFNQEQQQFFLYVWKQTGDPYKALEHYKGEAYDVIAVAGNPAVEEKCVYRDLQSFFANHRIAFDLTLHKEAELDIA